MQFIDPHLRRHLFGWKSPRLGLEMPIVRYGHYGPAMLLFPTAGGDFLEAERMFLIKSVEPALFAGKLQIFSIDSINPYAWTSKLSIPHKARNTSLYSGYVEEEVVPYIRNILGNPHARIGAMGASYGSFFAANAFFRRPDIFDTLLGMSGFYDLEAGGELEGFFNDDVYFNNPSSYVPHLPDGHALNLLRHHSQIHLLSSVGQWERPHFTHAFSEVLWRRGIPHNKDIWGADMPHDWTTWRAQVRYYVNERLGL